MDGSISCFENVKPIGSNERHFVKDLFDQRPGVGEIIPFRVWLIPFPVLKIIFELLGSNVEHFVIEVFFPEAWNWEI